jgi:hypothetical protein
MLGWSIRINSEVSYQLDHAPAGVAGLGLAGAAQTTGKLRRKKSGRGYF